MLISVIADTGFQPIMCRRLMGRQNQCASKSWFGLARRSPIDTMKFKPNVTITFYMPTCMSGLDVLGVGYRCIAEANHFHVQRDVEAA